MCALEGCWVTPSDASHFLPIGPTAARLVGRCVVRGPAVSKGVPGSISRGRTFPHEVWLPNLPSPVASPVPPTGGGRVVRSLGSPGGRITCVCLLPVLVPPVLPRIPPASLPRPAIGPKGGVAVHWARFGPVSGGTPIDCPCFGGERRRPGGGAHSRRLAGQGMGRSCVQRGLFQAGDHAGLSGMVARDGYRGGLGVVPYRG